MGNPRACTILISLLSTTWSTRWQTRGLQKSCRPQNVSLHPTLKRLFNNKSPFILRRLALHTHLRYYKYIAQSEFPSCHPSYLSVRISHRRELERLQVRLSRPERGAHGHRHGHRAPPGRHRVQVFRASRRRRRRSVRAVLQAVLGLSERGDYALGRQDEGLGSEGGGGGARVVPAKWVVVAVIVVYSTCCCCCSCSSYSSYGSYGSYRLSYNLSVYTSIRTLHT